MISRKWTCGPILFLFYISKHCTIVNNLWKFDKNRMWNFISGEWPYSRAFITSTIIKGLVTNDGIDHQKWQRPYTKGKYAAPLLSPPQSPPTAAPWLHAGKKTRRGWVKRAGNAWANRNLCGGERCLCEGYGFQAVWSEIGYRNQGVLI